MEPARRRGTTPSRGAMSPAPATRSTSSSSTGRPTARSLPGIDGDIASATLRLNDGSTKPLPISKSGTGRSWTPAPPTPPRVSSLAGLIELKFDAAPKIDQTLGIHPNITSKLSCEFATVTKAKRGRINWMEKFGEWKFSLQVGNWQPGGVAEWDVDVAEAGDYHVALTYKGEGRPVWSVSTSEGVKIQNQQAASPGRVLRCQEAKSQTWSVSPLADEQGAAGLLADPGVVVEPGVVEDQRPAIDLEVIGVGFPVRLPAELHGPAGEVAVGHGGRVAVDAGGVEGRA
jgi:hypothetical protein